MPSPKRPHWRTDAKIARDFKKGFCVSDLRRWYGGYLHDIEAAIRRVLLRQERKRKVKK